MKLSARAPSKVQHILLYGPPKVGKTQLAGSLAEHMKLIWFDMENGHATLLKFPEAWKDNIELVYLPDTKSFPIAIETILKVVKGGAHKICEDHGKIACPLCTRDQKPVTEINLSTLESNTVVVFDSLTQLSLSAVSHITKGMADDYQMKIQDWGNVAKLMDTFLSHIQQAPYNVICISHEVDVEKDDEKPSILVPVAGSKNTSKNTARHFDHVVYCRMHNNQHNFLSTTNALMGVAAGSRTDIDLNVAGRVASLVEFFKEPPTFVPGQDASTKKMKDILASLKKPK
jgi:DNA polymerase III delta prime subunit